MQNLKLNYDDVVNLLVPIKEWVTTESVEIKKLSFDSYGLPPETVRRIVKKHEQAYSQAVLKAQKALVIVLTRCSNFLFNYPDINFKDYFKDSDKVDAFKLVSCVSSLAYFCSDAIHFCGEISPIVTFTQSDIDAVDDYFKKNPLVLSTPLCPVIEITNEGDILTSLINILFKMQTNHGHCFDDGYIENVDDRLLHALKNDKVQYEVVDPKKAEETIRSYIHFKMRQEVEKIYKDKNFDLTVKLSFPETKG